ncbi:MAG: leucine-rich repeat domain-containing protein [Planctomyces sp.]
MKFSSAPVANFRPIQGFVAIQTIFALLLIIGCSDRKADPPSSASSVGSGNVEVEAEPELTEPPIAAESPEAIATLVMLKAKLQRDDKGFIIDVDLRGTSATDETLPNLAGLTKLRSLRLDELPVTDAGIAALSSFSGPLASLDARGCALTDSAMTTIAGIKTLRALRLSGDNNQTTIADDGIAKLAACPSLKVLAVDGLWVSSTSLQSLPSGIEELYLKSTLVDDDSMTIVAKFEGLRKLRISKTQVSNAGLEKLIACKRLEDLDLSEDSLINNDGMQSVGKILSLKKLNLWRVAINDSGIAHLAPLKQLNWLNLDNTQLTDAGLPALKDMTQLTFLHLGSTAVSDAGLSSLHHLQKLKDLKVTRTSVTETGVEGLKVHLPGTEVQLKYVENL